MIVARMYTVSRSCRGSFFDDHRHGMGISSRVRKSTFSRISPRQ